MAGLDGPKTGWRAGERAFVTLEEDETGDWRPVGAFKARPESGVFLQGRVRFVSARSDMRETPGQDDAELGEGRRERDAISGAERDVLSMVYNLEAYYAEADQARALDMMRNEDRLRLIVALAPDGSAVIKGLEIDGERRIDRVIGAPR